MSPRTAAAMYLAVRSSADDAVQAGVSKHICPSKCVKVSVSKQMYSSKRVQAEVSKQMYPNKCVQEITLVEQSADVRMLCQLPVWRGPSATLNPE